MFDCVSSLPPHLLSFTVTGQPGCLWRQSPNRERRGGIAQRHQYSTIVRCNPPCRGGGGDIIAKLSVSSGFTAGLHRSGPQRLREPVAGADRQRLGVHRHARPPHHRQLPARPAVQVQLQLPAGVPGEQHAAGLVSHTHRPHTPTTHTDHTHRPHTPTTHTDHTHHRGMQRKRSMSRFSPLEERYANSRTLVTNVYLKMIESEHWIAVEIDVYRQIPD